MTIDLLVRYKVSNNPVSLSRRTRNKRAKIVFGYEIAILVNIDTIHAQAMFTLYRKVKRSVAETVPDKASVHTKNATFGTISALEQDCFAPFLKDLMFETQRSTCSCSHCTGSVSATLYGTL